MPEPIMDDAVADEAAKSTPGNDAAAASDASGDPAEPSVVRIQVHADAGNVGAGRRRRGSAGPENHPGSGGDGAAAATEATEDADATGAAEGQSESEPVADDAAETDDDGETVANASGEEPCHQQALSARVEALLLASDRPMTESRLADICGLPRAGATARIRAALAELTEFHRASGRSFRPRKVAGGWQLVTLPAFGPLMARLHRDRQETRLSPAALETLSIIAYRQPVLRAELEAIRGVACGEVLRTLMERRLVSIVGRSEDLGRPMLHGTTRQFLEVFGLSSLEDLPEVPGLERRRPPRPAAASSADGDEADGGTAADAAVEASAATGADPATEWSGGDADAILPDADADADATASAEPHEVVDRSAESGA